MFSVGKTGAPYTLSCLSRQLIFPDLVEGLVLMNIDPNGKGWIDWAATKVRVVRLDRGADAGEGWGGWGAALTLASALAHSSPASRALYLTRCYPTSSAR